MLLPRAARDGRAHDRRLVREDLPHDVAPRERAAGRAGRRVDHARVLRPRADAAVLRHLGRPHMVAAVAAREARGARGRYGLATRLRVSSSLRLCFFGLRLLPPKLC